MSARNFSVAPKFLNGVFNPNFAFLNKAFSTRRRFYVNFSTTQNLGKRNNSFYPSQPATTPLLLDAILWTSRCFRTSSSDSSCRLHQRNINKKYFGSSSSTNIEVVGRHGRADQSPTVLRPEGICPVLRRQDQGAAHQKSRRWASGTRYGGK